MPPPDLHHRFRELVEQRPGTLPELAEALGGVSRSWITERLAGRLEVIRRDVLALERLYQIECEE